MGRRKASDLIPAEVEELLEDMRAFGYPPAEIQKAADDMLAKAAAPEVFDVHEDNVVAVKLFMAMNTQWTWIALSTMAAAIPRRVALKYEVLPQVARLEGLGRISTDNFRRIRIMEGEALEAFAEAARD